jgi:putative membrane protein
MLDLILAIAHHLAVFSLAGILAAELALLRPGIAGERLQQLGRLDGAYGGLAMLVIVVGVLRVFFGRTDAGYYIGNPVFWMKMAAFVGVGLLSIQPTIALARWRRSGRGDPAFTPPVDAIARSRRFLFGEVAVFVLIPVFAAAMARGFGL